MYCCFPCRRGCNNYPRYFFSVTITDFFYHYTGHTTYELKEFERIPTHAQKCTYTVFLFYFLFLIYYTSFCKTYTQYILFYTLHITPSPNNTKLFFFCCRERTPSKNDLKVKNVMNTKLIINIIIIPFFVCFVDTRLLFFAFKIKNGDSSLAHISK